MTPLELQDALVDEISGLFEHLLYKSPSGERVALNVYAQNLPKNDSDDDEDPVPYIIVRLSSGDDDGTRDSNNIVQVVIIVGLWDEESENQGHRDVMNIIQKIYQRFQENPNLNNRAVYTGAFHWATQEDSYYPYSFGACQLSFNIPALRREDEYA